MQTVTVNKKELLAKLQANREKHITAFKVIQEGYLADLQKEFKRFAKDFKKDPVNANLHNYFNDLEKPTSHEEEYTTVIKMLELSLDEKITLQRNEFRNYVEDLWNWTQTFRMSETKYNNAR